MKKPAQRCGRLQQSRFKPRSEAHRRDCRRDGQRRYCRSKEAFSKAYDDVIPKLKLDAIDPSLVGRLANLRGMVQSLPEREAKAFDAVIAREIDGRIAPNGVLSGQNLKDALAAIRDQGKKFSISPDAYQSDLGQAFKQLHKELLDEMMAKNGALGQQLKKVDTGYANFKRAERAASSVGNAGGDFTPAQLFNATKALDRSKDKGAFARGQALMQDLAGAGKRVMGNTVPDSGTAGRMLLSGGAIGGLAAMASGDGGVSLGLSLLRLFRWLSTIPPSGMRLLRQSRSAQTWQAMLLTRCVNTCLLLAVLWLLV